MTVLSRALLATGLAVVLVAPAALADRRYFVQSYTPYLATEGSLELETHTIARSGLDGTSATGFTNRIEFEYGMTDRLTTAVYLNFVQAPEAEAASRFDGPSLELIYQMAEPGKLPVDPAAYLEVRANGSEVEVEPKLLLARRIYRLVAVMNLVGEYERINAGDEAGETEKAFEVTAGLSREIGHRFAVGVESVYSQGLVDEGPDPSRWLVGPTVNIQTPKVQMALGWHWQASGSPASSGGLNLTDFPRSEVRLLVGINL
jgi:hypothetical protein